MAEGLVSGHQDVTEESGFCAVADGDGLRAVGEDVFLELIGPPTQTIIHNLMVSLIFSHLLPFFTWCW